MPGKVEIVRRFKIDAGHRVFEHQGKCKHLHGHEYKFEVYATCSELNKLGMIVDFSTLKGVLGQWLDTYWDHGMILYRKDPLIELFRSGPLQGHKLYRMATNPTAENLALELLSNGNLLMAGTGIRITKVVCHETENCRAIAYDSE